MKAFSLEGRSALVTGSSQGIGLAAGLVLKEAGARVVFHGLDAKPAEVPEDSRYVQSDLLADDASESLISQAFAAEPGLDILVCNAGSFFDLPVLEMTRERWDRTMNLNVRASFFLAQAFAKQLVTERRPGCIVITASTNGFQAEADSCAYDSSKGALVMLTRSLAVSLAPHGIRVNGIAPGLIRTPLTSVWMEPQSADLLVHYEKKILLGRVGTPEDCSGAVVFFCSDAASYITGEIMVIDGGLTVTQIGRK
ncbi:SDR family oxidoreductase [Roseimicrobium sp. ORNL1]|uniref:SDR family NAD(P)-dependent oxidoreductase n=1 Tax=Roseimicrobium sp. ORNL1 TaxID=2711231 RepID=UPI0013E1085E|nr:SDR family oxidoreductase [Roseimicrobium sp. ORNL1]QIF05237.1 SDR family oxidoreductase [Roseimicrobium sp. ORNL1]